MVKFAISITLFAFTQSILGGDASISMTQDVVTSPLRGGQKEQATRKLDGSYSCKLCNIRPENVNSIVTLTGFGRQSCKGFYDAALNGVVVSQNQCNSVRAEFSPVCCGVDAGPNGILIPGPGGTSPPISVPVPSTTAPAPTPPPTMVNFEKSCAAVTNSTGSCGGGNRANGLCADGSCCSQYGWCGKTPEYCNTDPLYST